MGEQTTIRRSKLFYPFAAAKQIDSLQNHPVLKNVVIALSNSNGPVKVTGHPYNNVVIQVTKQGKKNSFDHVHARVKSTKERIDIVTEYDDRHGHHNVSVGYELTVPHTATLEMIKSTNGKISINNVYGTLDCKTVNGQITITGSHDSVSAYSINGALNLSVQEFKANNTITLATVNGAIDCLLPKNISATLQATTTLGSINSNYKLESLGDSFTGKSLKGTIGAQDGGVIVLETKIGSILIR